MFTSVNQVVKTVGFFIPYHYSGSEAKSIDEKLMIGEVDVDCLQEEMETCKHSSSTLRRRMGQIDSYTLQWIL